MAEAGRGKTRRDSKRRVLRLGESVRADGNMTVCELVDRYLKTKTGVRQSTRTGYVTVQRILAKEAFGKKKIRSIKTSDVKLFLIKL